MCSWPNHLLTSTLSALRPEPSPLYGDGEQKAFIARKGPRHALHFSDYPITFNWSAMRRNIPKRLRLSQNWCRKLSVRPGCYSHTIYPQKSSLPRNLAAEFPNKPVRVSPEVEEAVQSGKPVVALETTIYTHGFPYPDNVALASHLESVVRLNGGVPATIGILNGVARVGLDPKELVELSSAAGKPETMKVSRRDLPYITGLVCTIFTLHGI